MRRPRVALGETGLKPPYRGGSTARLSASLKGSLGKGKTTFLLHQPTIDVMDRRPKMYKPKGFTARRGEVRSGNGGEAIRGGSGPNALLAECTAKRTKNNLRGKEERSSSGHLRT